MVGIFNHLSALRVFYHYYNINNDRLLYLLNIPLYPRDYVDAPHTTPSFKLHSILINNFTISKFPPLHACLKQLLTKS